MKILHLSSENTWRGGEQQIAYLIDEHLKSGVEIWVATRKDSAFSNHCEVKNINHIEIGFNGSFDLTSAKKISQYCSENSIDIIHAHSGKSHATAVLSQSFGRKTPVVLSRRVDFPIKNNAWAKWKYNHSSIKKIVCVSDAIKNILSSGIKDKNKLVTIHSGIDLNRFSNKITTNWLRNKYEISDDIHLIGNTSAIAPHKDYFTFVDACLLLKKSGTKAKYFIIGSGPEEKIIQEYVAQKGLESDIIFTGFLKNIEEVLPGLDVFLMTSETEGLGTSLIDSFAAKVPVVATAAGGIPELIIDNETGVLCKIKDSQILSEGVIKILENTAFRKKIIEGASKHLLQFSKEKTAEKTLAVYKDILGITVK